MKLLFLNIKHVALFILLIIQMEAIGQKVEPSLSSNDNNLRKYNQESFGLLPMTIKGLAKRQIDRFNESLKKEFVRYCNCYPEEYLLDVDALKKLLHDYDSTHPHEVAYLQIQLSEIQSSTPNLSYYNQNSKKLHYIFYLLRGNKTRIDNLPYDLAAEVTNLNKSNHQPYRIPPSDIDNFNQAFEANSKVIIKAISPKFERNNIRGLQFVNIPISHIRAVIHDDQYFNQFSISLGVINSTDTPFKQSERKKYTPFKGMDNVLNLLFQKRYPDTNHPIDINYYDLNDLCPPGNCNLD